MLILEKHINDCKRELQRKMDKCYNKGNYRGQDKYEKKMDILDRALEIMLEDSMPNISVLWSELEWDSGTGTENR